MMESLSLREGLFSVLMVKLKAKFLSLKLKIKKEYCLNWTINEEDYDIKEKM
jgi:hypothetical protein